MALMGGGYFTGRKVRDQEDHSTETGYTKGAIVSLSPKLDIHICVLSHKKDVTLVCSGDLAIRPLL